MDVQEDEELAMLDHRSSSNPTSEDGEEMQAQIIVFYPNKSPIAYKLHAGVNVIGRRSSLIERDEARLREWDEQFKGEPVHGVFLESSSVSSAHAAIYLESWGDLCFVKDLKSRNKTFLKQNGHHKALEPFTKNALQSGGSLTFGALRCRISFGASFERLPNLPSIAANVTRSSAISISQHSSELADQMGSTSLDKCPSLQEWFAYPGGVSPPGEHPFPARQSSGSQNSDLIQRYSFGFNPQFADQDDHTSSDAEPETPRIDKPTAFARLRSAKLPLQNSGLAPMLEDEKEGQDSDGMEEQNPVSTKSFHAAVPSLRPNGLEEADLKWVNAFENNTNSPSENQRPGNRPPSPSASLTEEEAEMSDRASNGQNSPLKRTRSDKQFQERPRSKSPRLQRGFAVREPSFRLEEMREAVSKIGTKS